MNATYDDDGEAAHSAHGAVRAGPGASHSDPLSGIGDDRVALRRGPTEASEQLRMEAARRAEAEDAAERVRRRYHFQVGASPQMEWTALPDGWTDYYTQRWWDYTGLPLGETEWTWTRVLHPSEVDSVRAAWA